MQQTMQPSAEMTNRTRFTPTGSEATDAQRRKSHELIGELVVGKANHSQHGWYNQAFFNLSIGFERAAKLAIDVDYALNHAG